MNKLKQQDPEVIFECRGDGKATRHRLPLRAEQTVCGIWMHDRHGLMTKWALGNMHVDHELPVEVECEMGCFGED